MAIARDALIDMATLLGARLPDCDDDDFAEFSLADAVMIAGVKRSQTRFERVVVAISALTGITVSDQAVRSLISIVSV